MLSRMDGSAELTETQHKKYQKLASEYSKLRARAGVLRNAVLDEQSKGESLREQLRQSETALRRSEQEVDSLGFRNRQLEHRVAALQDEIAKREGRTKTDKEYVRKLSIAGKGHVLGAAGEEDMGQDALIFEELQKKIMENAELTTMVDDKEHELQIHGERLLNLQKMIEKRNTEFTETEKSFRRDFEVLQKRNAELESKLVDAISMLGSEDALSATGSDHTPLHVAAQHHDQSTLSTTSVPTAEERICSLEKEMVHWRTQYEILKINEAVMLNDTKNGLYENNITCSSAIVPEYSNCSCSSTAAGLMVKSSSTEVKSSRDSNKEPTLPPTKEQLLYNNFCQKFEHLLKSKYLAESRMFSYETEVEHLQICLENATHELNSKDEQIESINQALKMLEEDLVATTRINYEEQISVLTEQVINLSEQLAASK
nr:protein phosphatase 1 regulatory subunit 21 isoform X1 [Bactrocera oleae]